LRAIFCLRKIKHKKTTHCKIFFLPLQKIFQKDPSLCSSVQQLSQQVTLNCIKASSTAATVKAAVAAK